MMRKLIRILVGYLPVSRRRYQEALVNINTVLDGFSMSEAQHGQIMTLIMRDLANLKQPKKPQDPEKNEGDPAFV